MTSRRIRVLLCRLVRCRLRKIRKIAPRVAGGGFGRRTIHVFEYSGGRAEARPGHAGDDDWWYFGYWFYIARASAIIPPF